MTVLRNALIVTLALLVQTSWSHAVSVYGIAPDIVLVAVVWIGVRSGQIEATIFGFVSGFLLDVYNPEFMGVNALANAVVGFAVGYTRGGIDTDGLLIRGGLVLAAGVLHDTIFFTFSSISNPGEILPQVFRYGLGTAFYSALVAVGLSILTAIRFRGGLHLDVRRFHE